MLERLDFQAHLKRMREKYGTRSNSTTPLNNFKNHFNPTSNNGGTNLKEHEYAASDRDVLREDYEDFFNTPQKAPSKPVDALSTPNMGKLSEKSLDAVRGAFRAIYGDVAMGTEMAIRAVDIINGNRQSDYGSPKESFSRIADMWSGYKGVHFSSYDVALMLALLKISRAKNGPWKGSDSIVDLVGYALLADELMPVKGGK